MHPILIITLGVGIIIFGLALAKITNPSRRRRLDATKHAIMMIYFRDRTHGSAGEIARYLNDDYTKREVENALVQLRGQVDVIPNGYGTPIWRLVRH